MDSTVLSGEQLVTAQSRTEYELPSVGVKNFQPTHSWLENKQIQSALDSRKDLLDLERVEKWSSLMHAEWRPDKRKAAVTDKGKPWEVFGHHSDNGDWLFPEEVLLLMEMNLLECLYWEIPLSIQRGYSVLLGPENGCSLDEYKVFAHLCRAGYRVVRHLPDLTVTAYERQVRLDQHLDLRTTYDEPSQPQELPRPDLPPKKILDLQENTEITIESPGPSSIKTDETIGAKPKEPMATIEIIDVSDSSSDESSDDSDVEIIHETRPPTGGNIHKVEVSSEDLEELDIVELPLVQKEIVVVTIDCTDSESDSDRSYDGNWKRRPNHFMRPDSMKNLTFSAVEEFCSERINNVTNIDVNNDNAPSEPDPSHNEVDPSKSVDFLSFSESKTMKKQSRFVVALNRRDILDLMPTMFGQKGKLMTLDVPDPRLIPASISPKNKFYTYNMSTLRARTYSTNFRGYFRGRRNFHGLRFNNYNPNYNPNYNSVTNYGSPPAVSNGLMPLTQMFGSDVQSVARGMMQFASSLLMNMPQNRQDSSLMPFHQQRNMPYSNHRDSPHNFNSPPIFIEPPRNFNTPVHTRFSDSPIHSSSPNLTGANNTFGNRSSGADFSFNSRSSETSSDFDTHARTFSPPCAQRFNNYNRFSQSRGRPNTRNISNHTRSLSAAPNNFRAVDPVLPHIDPAYIKPDIPLTVEQDGRDGDCIPIMTSSTKTNDVIEIVDLDNDPPLRRRGNGWLLTRAEKRKKKRMRKQMAKKFCRKREPQAVQEVVFLDDTTSEATVKQENYALIADIKTDQNDTVKQEAVPAEVDPTAQVKLETFESQEIKVEGRNDPVVKSEGQPNTSSGVRVNIGQDSSGTNLLVEIKIEGTTNEVSARMISAVVKTEGDNNIKTEPDSSSEVESPVVKKEPVEVKTEQGVVEVKKEKSPEEITSKQNLSQNPTSEPAEVVAEVSSTSVFTECSVSQANVVESNEMEVESSECDVVRESTTEKSKDSVDELDSEMAVDVSENSSRPSEEVQSVDGGDQSKIVVQTNEKSGTTEQIAMDTSQEAIDTQSLDNGAKDKSEVFPTPLDTTEGTITEMVVEAPSKNLLDVQENMDNCEMDVDVQSETVPVKEQSCKLDEKRNGKEKNQGNISSWAEVTKPLTSQQENDDKDKESDDEDDSEIRPLVKPKDCRTIGSVLAALQIFSPIAEPAPEDTPKLKISFDLYLAADFKKSHRGLPHYRIVVFSGSDPMPSPAQVREVHARFKDSVPILRAVVMPGSVVFYAGADLCLPVDDTSYTK